MTKDIKDKVIEAETRLPPEVPIKSLQFDLFSQFVSNDESKISNSVEIWESIPKYFFTHQQIKKLRPEKGQPDPYKWTYEKKGQEYSVVIQPALLEEPDGTFKAYFPSYTEELVEEALKKFLTIQNYGIHNADKHETWIRFTLSMISKELRELGKGRDRATIKQALLVMSRCVLTLYKGKKEIWNGAILQDLVTVNREEYIEDTDAYHAARLPLFVSHAIDSLQGRQFNYGRLMQCDGQLSRWIYRRLINRFTQASMMDSYHFKYSDLKHSGLLQLGFERDNRAKVLVALNELVKQGVISVFEIEKQLQGRKIVDVKYTIFAGRNFIAEQKAANKRTKDNRETAAKLGYKIPSNKLAED